MIAFQDFKYFYAARHLKRCKFEWFLKLWCWQKERQSVTINYLLLVYKPNFSYSLVGTPWIRKRQLNELWRFFSPWLFFLSNHPQTDRWSCRTCSQSIVDKSLISREHVVGLQSGSIVEIVHWSFLVVVWYVSAPSLAPNMRAYLLTILSFSKAGFSYQLLLRIKNEQALLFQESLLPDGINIH